MPPVISPNRTDVSVMGLGEMGGALARALLDAGHRVTVWNRTDSKAVPFAARGADVAPSAVAAATSSPLTIICMSSYGAALEALAAAGDLRGRTLVQLSSGTPGDARDAALWAADRGADYLDGAILAWPRQIGGPDAALIVSGPTQVYDRAVSTLRALVGQHHAFRRAHRGFLGARRGHPRLSRRALDRLQPRRTDLRSGRARCRSVRGDARRPVTGAR